MSLSAFQFIQLLFFLWVKKKNDLKKRSIWYEWSVFSVILIYHISSSSATKRNLQRFKVAANHTKFLDTNLYWVWFIIYLVFPYSCCSGLLCLFMFFCLTYVHSFTWPVCLQLVQLFQPFPILPSASGAKNSFCSSHTFDITHVPSLDP